MYAESFPSKLKKARKDTGFTQIEIEKELNIPRSTLANWEIGRTQPDIESLGILADFYEVSVDWLIGTKGGQ
jgi:transcriptional regulator with XRE-family HTH domain